MTPQAELTLMTVLVILPFLAALASIAADSVDLKDLSLQDNPKESWMNVSYFILSVALSFYCVKAALDVLAGWLR